MQKRNKKGIPATYYNYLSKHRCSILGSSQIIKQIGFVHEDEKCRSSCVCISREEVRATKIGLQRLVEKLPGNEEIIDVQAHTTLEPPHAASNHLGRLPKNT